MDFPHPPRLTPPRPPSVAEIINAPLKVAARGIARFESDMTQIASDIEAIGQPLGSFISPPALPATLVMEPPLAAPKAPRAPAKGTACLQCTGDHLSTLTASLNEAMRFARDGGVDQEEVQRRLLLATDELNICERIDLAPDATAALGPKEKEVAQWVLPQLRKLRHSLKEVDSTEDLEQVAAAALEVRQTYTARYKQAKGV